MILLEAGAQPPVPLKSSEADTREVINYMRAMEHGLESRLPASLRLIRDLHGVLMRGVRGDRERPGEFRNIQNFIGRRGDTIGTARFVPPPVAEMREALNELEVYFHEETADTPPPLIKLALIHYQFETIHPFRDGNGRIGRLLLPLMMVKSNMMKQPLLYLSGYFEQHRDEYMDRLLAVSQRGDWDGWIDFFLAGVSAQAGASCEQAQALLSLRDRYLETFRKVRSSATLQTLIEHLFLEPSITIGGAAKLLNVSIATASANLNKLVDEKILREITGRRKGRFFIADAILSFSRDDDPAPRSEDEPITRTAG
jgi:Fic family protein